MEIKDILSWYNIRAREGNCCSFNGIKGFESFFIPESLIKLYRGEGIETFPFLSLSPFDKEPYVETLIYPGGVMFISFRESSFNIDKNDLKKSLYEHFPSDENNKFGFLVLEWNKNIPQCRTDRHFRKDYISVEAYNNGKCLYINIYGDEGMFEMSYNGLGSWGEDTLNSFNTIKNIVERKIKNAKSDSY